MWFIGVEVALETSAPPPKKNPGSAPEYIYSISTTVYLQYINSIASLLVGTR